MVTDCWVKTLQGEGHALCFNVRLASGVGKRQGWGPPMSVGAQAGLGFPNVTGSWVRCTRSFSCRGKSCRTITFEQFKEALEELSKKRFKDKSSEEAVREVHRLIEGKAPIISGVTVSGAAGRVPREMGSMKWRGQVVVA